MNRVGVRELRQNLSVYLRRVKNGEVLEVTERGEPVARLEPITAPDDPLAALEARGLRLRRATGKLEHLPQPAKLDLDPPLSATVVGDREDRI